MSLPETVQLPIERSVPRAYEGLREWLDIVESMGELKRIHGADWNLEIGTLAELFYRKRPGTTPAILFDRIKDYPEKFRVMFGTHCSFLRLALSLGLPLDSAGLALVDRYREKIRGLKPVSPRVVEQGPALENQLAGDAIDVLKFPVP